MITLTKGAEQNVSISSPVFSHSERQYHGEKPCVYAAAVHEPGRQGLCDRRPGSPLSRPGRSLLVQMLLKKDVELLRGAKVEQVDQDRIVYTQDGREHCIQGADTLVLAVGCRSAPAWMSR